MGDTVAIYARISEDVLGAEKGVERQLTAARDVAEQRGWTVAAEYPDNDISALNGAYRPQYDAMLRAAERGEFTRIIAFQLSRLWRNRRERAEAIELLSRLRIPITLVRGADLDLTTSMGRSFAAQLGESDTLESEQKSERVAEAALQRAQEGRANGHAAYGWRREYHYAPNGLKIGFTDTIDLEQAAIVQELADRLLSGWSMNRLRDDLNARGIPSPQGKQWRASTIRKVLLRPANVARRVHHGTVLDGVTAAWPPILDADVWARCVELLQDPERVTTRGGARRHLLTFGIGRCGVCGAHLRVVQRWRNPRRKEQGKAPLYVCDSPRSCVGRRQEWVDDVVEAAIWERLARPDARDLFTRRDDTTIREARERAAAVRARLSNAADAYAEGDIDAGQLKRITAKLRPELEQAERDALSGVRGVAPQVIAELTGDDVEARWGGLLITQRRAVLEELMEAVTIMPARGGAGFKPDSVVITWRGE